MRRSIVGLLALVLAVGCTSSGGDTSPSPSMPRPSLPDTVPSAAIPASEVIRQARGIGSSFQVPVQSTERISDGAVTIENIGARSIQLLSIEPVFAAGEAPGAVLGVHTVRRSADEDYVGITRTYPPAGVQLVPIADSVLVPNQVSGDRYQIIIGLAVVRGTVAVRELRVTYRLDGAVHAVALPHRVTLCAGRPANATTCG